MGHYKDIYREIMHNLHSVSPMLIFDIIYTSTISKQIKS